MADFLSDIEILKLIAEPKRVSADFRRRAVPKPKRGHAETDLQVMGDGGTEFRFIFRRANINPLDFSLILGYQVPGSSLMLRLRRYNGKSHEHTNPLEGDTFYDYHVHTATERYQRTGNREDAYAEATDRYTSLDEAVACFIEDCNVVMPDDPQMRLFTA